MEKSEKYTTAEKQLITSLAWFRSRYALFMGLELERKADKESVEEFGQMWIGDFKENWDSAFVNLGQKNIIKNIDGEYCFSEYGDTVKNELDADTPFYKYEYDNYFQLDNKSIAHSNFCERVYGMDLSQHGLIDQTELLLLIDKLKYFTPSSILDVGCGNGKITEWISNETKINCTGLDISTEAIKYATERSKGNSKLQFSEGNLNDLKSLKKHDCVLFLDTLYYAKNLTETVRQALQLLTDEGRIYAYFSQWIMDVNYQENLLADNTHLAKALKELNASYTYIDLTTSGLNHWKRKLDVLNSMKKDFIDEGSKDLWEYRFREANRYANWGDEKYSRYLYEIRTN
jgi:2-polyprenyl-3-methyl-5-hydroxy-6-metoxy-1,4-benzoquinol methylase